MIQTHEKTRIRPSKRAIRRIVRKPILIRRLFTAEELLAGDVLLTKTLDNTDIRRVVADVAIAGNRIVVTIQGGRQITAKPKAWVFAERNSSVFGL